MLTNETKRRIDTARDILVGKLPDPKSQVEQITIALIYKFMDDMDKQSEELGGISKFFSGEYKKYSWSKIFDPRVSGYELVVLYGEAIQKMNQNPNIPQLFRDIFKNAYLPYRDPETLKMFLKVIGEFEYDHSEKLGDAFEYLLSVMGSQGDAGQFRTPRHIIDFIVSVVEPRKEETVLDPACGTAGFLISSYKHILEKNKKDGRIHLTPAQKTRLIENFSGYDISPDMVRLSLVNMYLHDFQNPKIHEYDTLTSEERWHEVFDVILANPPFMSPKGGIRPHKRFSVQAKRSEVLFVDYIAEHLNPNGRAGIIVPEGIIFQSGAAYKKLRKMLIEYSLYAVVSLPAGVFNPYSGVKTSILLLDKNLSKKTDKILFVKVNNDGFGLGAQRREIRENDLPLALEIIKRYKQSIIENKECEFNANEIKLASLVEKTRIAESGDYNLSGDRYKEAIIYSGKWDFVELGDVTEFKNGLWKGQKEPFQIVKIIRNTNFGKKGELDLADVAEHPVEIKQLETRKLKNGDIVLENSGGGPTQPVGRVIYFDVNTNDIYSWSNFTSRITVLNENVDSKYLFYVLNGFYQKGETEKFQKRTSGIRNLDKKAYQQIKIPLPPLEVQEQIVAELDSYQKIIDGARQVVENYKPHIDVDPDWPTVALDKTAEVTSSKRIFQHEYVSEGIPFYRTKEIVELSQGRPISLELFISSKKYEEIKKKFDVPGKNEILISAVGTIGISWVIPDGRQFYFKDGNLLWIKNIKNCNPHFLKLILHSILSSKLNEMVFGAAYKALTIVKLKQVRIPIPNLDIQQKIVAQLEKEQKAVEATRDLIALFEQKIKDRISDVWGEKTV